MITGARRPLCGAFSLRVAFVLLGSSFLSLSGPLAAQGAQWTFQRLAGAAGGAGYDDGPGATALFARPASVAVDAAGNRYVADTYNHTIRRIDAAGNVTTLAGRAGTLGYADGKGGAARFSYPNGLAVDASGIVYVADTYSHRIRKIDTAGNVSTLAGNGTYGFADGPGPAAMFKHPSGVAIDASGIVFVADFGNQRIRRIDTAGNVSTLAGNGTYSFADGPAASAMFRNPSGVAVDASGIVYVADTKNNRIRKIDTAGNVSTLAGNGTWGFADGPGATAVFGYPWGVAVDASGVVYVGDGDNYRIRKIDIEGNVSTLAGNGTWGFADGPTAAAMFRSPDGVAVDASGIVYVADGDNNRIRKIDIAGNVSTLAGSGSDGFANGPAASAKFDSPNGVAIDASGVVYVADSANNRIRKIDTAGNVSTLAGNGSYGFADGPAASAMFGYPYGVAVDASGIVFVAVSGIERFRKIDTAGNVSTLAGNGSYGFADGPATSAMFGYPYGVAVDASGIVYVADSGNYRIRKIDTAGNVFTLAGNGSYGFADGPAASAMFGYPYGVAVDASGNVYVADTGNQRIRKIDTAGIVSSVATGLNGPTGVVVDSSGNLAVADEWGNRIALVASGTGAVTTMAGSYTPGSFEGTGSAAGFNRPTGIAWNGSDARIIVADSGNNAIRVGEPALPDVATIDAAEGPRFTPRQLDTSPQTATTWKWELVRRPTGSTATLSSTTTRNPVFTPDVADVYVFRLTAADPAGKTSGTLVTLTATTPCIPPPAPLLTVPSLVCSSSAGNLASVLYAGVGAGYEWQITNGVITSGSGTRQITFTAGADGTVGLSVVVTPSGGCPSAEAAIGIPIRSLCLNPIPTPLVVGATNTFTGSGFTAGSVIKLFVSTASGADDTNPAGWAPTSWTPTSLTWDIPPSIPLGQGFGSLLVVNTDQGYVTSNVQGQLLHGDEADGLPTILAIKGVGLSAYDPSIPGAHVETVLAAGSTVTITGTGFSGPLVNLYTATGNVGPLTPLADGTSTSFQVVIPAGAPAGPGTFQVVNSGSGWTLSNAVAAVLRARISVTSVSVVESTVTVTGDGFCALTVINLFNVQGGGVVNLGSLNPDGTAVIPLNVLDAQHFTFTLPAGAQPGQAYVMALNPPYTPFTSSGTDTGGAFTVQ